MIAKITMMIEDEVDKRKGTYEPNKHMKNYIKDWEKREKKREKDELKASKIKTKKL